MKWILERKTKILPQIWRALSEASRKHDHPMRTPALGTGLHHASSSSICLRTVVLRQVLPAKRALVFHTDIRSAKCRDIQAHPIVHWLFYDPEEKVQIKALARARIHHLDREARQAWRQTPLPSRVNYGTPQPPGTPISRPGSAWNRDASPRNLTVHSSERGWPHFALVSTTVTELEWLRLSPEGHRRLRFSWPQNRLQATWLVP